MKLKVGLRPKPSMNYNHIDYHTTISTINTVIASNTRLVTRSRSVS